MASRSITYEKELFWFISYSCIRKQSSKVVADLDRNIWNIISYFLVKDLLYQSFSLVKYEYNGEGGVFWTSILMWKTITPGFNDFWQEFIALEQGLESFCNQYLATKTMNSVRTIRRFMKIFGWSLLWITSAVHDNMILETLCYVRM